MIDLMFNASAAAMQAVAAIPRHLGAQLGITGVLHTWGRQLQLHPHLHLIVPGGGLRADGTWATPKKPDYLLPHRAVAAAFRARMDDGLRAALPSQHAQVPMACWRAPWVVDIASVGHGEAAIKYLARYVQRTAISDARIQFMDEHAVRFGYVDSATQVRKSCRLDADEFMRRYLQHVLPAGVHRVRYFGWEHPAAGRRRRQVETLLHVVIAVTEKPKVVQWHLVCPHCQTETLVCVRSIPRARAPPWSERWVA